MERYDTDSEGRLKIKPEGEFVKLSDITQAHEKEISILIDALNSINQMSDPGSYERAIIDMKKEAREALAKFRQRK